MRQSGMSIRRTACGMWPYAYFGQPLSALQTKCLNTKCTVSTRYTRTPMHACVCVHVFRVFINCLQFADINLRNKFPRRTQTKESETESVKESKREKYFRPSAPQIFNEY